MAHCVILAALSSPREATVALGRSGAGLSDGTPGAEVTVWPNMDFLQSAFTILVLAPRRIFSRAPRSA